MMLILGLVCMCVNVFSIVVIILFLVIGLCCIGLFNVIVVMWFEIFKRMSFLFMFFVFMFVFFKYFGVDYVFGIMVKM